MVHDAGVERRIEELLERIQRLEERDRDRRARPWRAVGLVAILLSGLMTIGAAVSIKDADLQIHPTGANGGDDSYRLKLIGTATDVFGNPLARAMQLQNVADAGIAYRLAVLDDAGAERLTVESGGDVGINDSDPTYRLDVNGTGRFTSSLDVNGAATVGGNLTSSNHYPDSTGTRNLGSSASEWSRLYLSSGIWAGTRTLHFHVVNWATSDSTVWTHPATGVELKWDATNRRLGIYNGDASTHHVVITGSDSATVSTTVGAGATQYGNAQSGFWNLRTFRWQVGSPNGFLFMGASNSQYLGGVVVYWF